MANLNVIVLKNAVIKYNHIQDRLCMAGAFGDKGLISAWLTQRFLKVFLRKLDTYLAAPDRKLGDDQVNQNIVKKQVSEQINMVRDFIDELGSQNIHPLLVSNIKIKMREEHLVLLFEIQDDPRSLVLALSQSNLKKWLKILYKQFIKSGWPIDAWSTNLINYLEN